MSPGRRDERGYAAILVALFVTFLMAPLCALSIDVSRWYVEAAHLQNAADAASLAGVTFLPDDFASARATAISVAARNGYADSGTTQVAVSVGAKPTQLRVTISSTVANAFGAAFGQGHSQISRSATADYNGPVPMGSPCNTFGNEPPGAGTGASDPVRGPVASVIAPPVGGAACTSSPQFWASIVGPDMAKVQGDQFDARSCTSGENGCSGSTNTDFDPSGEWYDIHVSAPAVGQPVTLQVYDPAYVETGSYCDFAPPYVSYVAGGVFLRSNMNLYAPTDADQRYSEGTAAHNNPFCPGDTSTNAWGEQVVTSYDVRQPSDAGNPASGTAIPECEHQYPPYTYADDQTKSQVTLSALMQFTSLARDPNVPTTTPNPGYNPALAQVFHQWVKLCSFTPTAVGDYYLQVRTDVPLGGVSDGQGGYTGNSQVWAQSGDNPNVHGAGTNAFALRAYGGGAGGVTVSAWQRMTIWANYGGAQTTFNLARVIPAAAGEVLNLGFFDVGDASVAGTITVLPPIDSNLTSPLSGCVGVGVLTGTLSGCSIGNVSNATGFNGKEEHIQIPIPSSYTCNATQQGGCWFRLIVSFPSTAAVHDQTTWTADVLGDPVRLIQ